MNFLFYLTGIKPTINNSSNMSTVVFICVPGMYAVHREVCEGTNQAPIATVSTYPKHSRTACNWPCTEQQSTYLAQQYVRVDQTAACDNAGQQTKTSVLPKATMYVRLFAMPFPPLCCCP